MVFRQEFQPESLAIKLQHKHKLMLLGSCFTEQMGTKMSRVKFRTLENPHGILFNPASICKSVQTYIQNKVYLQEDLFEHEGIWGSWDHHTRFSDVNSTVVLEKINESQKKAHDFLKEADWLMLTLGSAFLYEKMDVGFVANCHKVPTDKFRRRLMATEEIISMFKQLFQKLLLFNPHIKILFTISPVRHLREGFIENNRSKANLINAVHQLIADHQNIFYFPAYELIIDDLRDYRFFAEDMVHPNHQATSYVWEKFQQTCIEESDLGLIKEMHQLDLAKNHKAFNPDSNQHKLFLKKCAEKAQALMLSHTHLDLQEEITFFNQG